MANKQVYDILKQKQLFRVLKMTVLAHVLLCFATLFSPIAYGSSQVIRIPQGLMQTGLHPELIAKFALFVAVLLVWTLVVGKVLYWFFRLPTIAGQIIGGILLGPSLINIASCTIFAEQLYVTHSHTAQMYAFVSSDFFVSTILLISSAWTVSYLLWIAGHETDVQDIYHIGLAAIAAGFFGAVLPIMITVVTMYYGMATGWQIQEMVAMGLALAATSVSIPVAMLIASNKMHLRSSKATLGAAIVDDILAVIFLSLFFIAVEAGFLGTIFGTVHGERKSLFWAMLAMICTFGTIYLFGTYCMRFIMVWLKKHHYSHLIAPIAKVNMLLHFACAELLGGFAGITGAYFAGLFHKKGDEHHLAEKVFSPYVNAILLPLFLGSIGLSIDVRILSWADWGIVAILLIVAIISKLAGCLVATVLSNVTGANPGQPWTWLETYLFGASMVARGEVGLVVATVLYGAKVFAFEQYVIAIMVIVLSTIITPIMLAIGFDQMSSIDVERRYVVNLGMFDAIGTQEMFHIIVERLEASGEFRTSVDISENKKVVNIDGQGVKIILCPDEGIFLEGNKGNISTIVSLVKKTITKDIDRLVVR